MLAISFIFFAWRNLGGEPLPWEETVKEFMVLRVQLRYTEGERLLVSRLAIESRQEGRGELYVWLATVRHETGRFESAEHDYMRSLSELSAVYGEHSAVLQRPLLGLASLHMETGRVELAQRDFAQASGLEPSQSAEDRLTLLHTGAMVLDARGSLTEAEREYRRVLALTESTLGPSHPALGPILNNLGAVLIRHKQYATALPILVKAAAILAEAPAQDRVRSLMNIATARHGIRDETAAERISAEAMDLIASVWGLNHPDMAEMLHLRAAILNRLGRKHEARESLARSLEIARRFQRHTVDLRELPARR